MKEDNIKIIGGGLFAVEIETETDDKLSVPSQDDSDLVRKNKEQIEYLKTIKKVREDCK